MRGFESCRSSLPVRMLWAGLSILVGGCSDRTEALDPGALRGAFPDRADEVLAPSEGFVSTAGEFAWTTSPKAGAWVRVEAELPRDAESTIRLRVRGFEVRVRELGAEGRGAQVEQAVAYRRTGGTSYWTAAGSGVEGASRQSRSARR